ncbi:MAG: large subunit ribosomal protein [Gaiellaceae bacterium]|nr:large subunit ribosomal protein [Gaiellaceae bacterium]
MTEYAIISLCGKQYVVHEGERFLVDRLDREEGKTFSPDILFLGGGKPGGELSPKNATVTAKVLGHVLGDKIRIGKYKPKSGYKRHNGYRSRLTQIEITAIGGAKRASSTSTATTAAPKEAAPKEAAPKEAAPKEVAAPKEAAAPKGLPKGYADLTVAEVKEGTEHWNRPMLEAALAYEQEHGQRKGAIAALESALAAKEQS